MRSGFRWQKRWGSGQLSGQMQEILPRYGVEVVEIPRRQIGGQAVSASRVRALLAQGQMEKVQALVPLTTWDFLQTEEGQAIARRAGERP